VRVLLVEDDDVYGPALARALGRRGHDALRVGTLEEALGFDEETDAAVVDLALPDGSGVDAVRVLSARGVKVVVLTGHGTIPSTVECMRAGAVDFLTKPVSTDELLTALERVPEGGEGPRSLKLDDVEREHILAVLASVDGNVSEAARRLGLYRRTLQRKLHKLG